MQRILAINWMECGECKFEYILNKNMCCPRCLTSSKKSRKCALMGVN